MTGQETQTNEGQIYYGLVWVDGKGDVNATVSDNMNQATYEVALEVIKRNASEVLFQRYGVSKSQRDVFEDLKELDEEPFSKVANRVEGLVDLLKGETQ